MNIESPADAEPSQLFKYVSFDTARIVLATGRLRWTTPPLLNDPFDLSFDLHLDADPQLVRRLALELLWADYLDDSQPAPLEAFDLWKADVKAASTAPTFEAFCAQAGPIIDRAIARSTNASSVTAMNAELQANLRSAKLLCLSETPSNMLMWAHYGQQHFGAVLRFTREGEGNAFGAARPVTYTQAMPRFADSTALAGLIAGRLVDTKKLMASQVYTKAADWSYEREWRIQFGKGRDPRAPFEDLPFGDELLTGLVLGCRMSPENCGELIALAQSLNPEVELFLAKPAAREFAIEVEPFDLP